MNADEFAQSMQTLGTRYVEEYTRAMQRYLDLLNNVASSSRSGSERSVDGSADIQRRLAQFVVAEAPRVFSQLSEAGIKYYTTLAEVGMRAMDGYLTSVAQAGEPMSGKREPERSASGALLFHGVQGQTASNAFLISNHRAEAIDVEFDIPEVVSDDGGERFRPKAEFTPKVCKLAPHAERVVQCSLSLSEGFKPGQGYSGSIAVVGLPEMAMRFTVQVEAAAASPAKKAGAGKPRRRATATAKKTPKKKAARSSKR
jgi:hypothetical protein